jgi:broad specificity phosphatase PhoE
VGTKQRFDAPTVLFGRHAETAWNTGDPDTDKAKGTKNDLPLTGKGIEKANEDAQLLSGYDIAEAHRSAMLRSKQTVAPVLAATGAKEIVNAAFDPWDVGYLSGMLRKDIADRVEYYIAHPKRTVPDGISYGEFWDAITEAFASVLKRAEELEDEDEYPAIYINGHSDGIEAVESWLKDNTPSAHTVEHSQSPGAILMFQKRKGSWKVSEWEGTKSSEKDEE